MLRRFLTHRAGEVHRFTRVPCACLDPVIGPHSGQAGSSSPGAVGVTLTPESTARYSPDVGDEMQREALARCTATLTSRGGVPQVNT